MSGLRIRWLGHAGFRVSFPDNLNPDITRVVYIDTWLQNPKLPEDFKGVIPDDADLVLVTHGHFDHSSSSPDLIKNSKKEKSMVIANYEIGLFF
jgi:L-ascorbate metabolism protein UlaG (beta-lactamase superfamily)